MTRTGYYWSYQTTKRKSKKLQNKCQDGTFAFDATVQNFGISDYGRARGVGTILVIKMKQNK